MRLKSTVVFILIGLIYPLSGHCSQRLTTNYHLQQKPEYLPEEKYKWPYLGIIPAYIGINGSFESFRSPLYSVGLSYNLFSFPIYTSFNEPRAAFCGIEGRYKFNQNNQVSGWDINLIARSRIGIGTTYGSLKHEGNQTNYFGIIFSVGTTFFNVAIMHRFFNWEKNKIPELHHTVLMVNFLIPGIRISKNE
ncbi:MAG: hypothetical protein K1X56_01980 [Flavobacteriales bacterium]|nr:hypothetical protein [Flavobacteriales bacterium]